MSSLAFFVAKKGDGLLISKEIIELVKVIIETFALCGIVIDLTPGIKVYPVRWLLKKIGETMNHDIKEQLDEIKKDFQDHKIESQRYEILDFANSCMNGRKHTKEEFDHIIAVHDDYEQYLEKQGLKNGQVQVAYDFLKKIYLRCIEKNSFLTGKENLEDEKN